MLTTSVKASQAFVSSTSQKKPELQNAPSAPGPVNLQPDPVQNGKHLMAAVDYDLV